MKRALIAAAALFAATPAMAQGGDEPRFCPNRPDLGSSGCTTKPGEFQLEVTGVDWQRDTMPDEREDRIVAGDFVARLGVGPRTEVQLAWTPYGHIHTRDRLTGTVTNSSGVGDVTLAVRQNLRAPDGKGLSYGVQPFVTAPTGTGQVGDGDWAAGVLLPVTYDLGERVNLAFTGEVDAAVDDDRDGRHLAASGILGLGYDLSDSVTAIGEITLERDNDPAGHETHALAAASLAWRPAKTWQLDLLGVAGLDRSSPDFRLVVGGAVLFR